MRSRLHLPLALALAAVIATAASACGGDDDETDKGAATRQSAAPSAPGKASSSSMPDYAGAVATPPKQAPALKLKDSTGKPFDMSQHRGKVVLLTWLYVKCPDVCPLIVSNLKTAQTKLGSQGEDVVIVAVSTDPERDTPKAVNQFLEARGMQTRMQYLVGSESKLHDVWRTWGVTAEPAAANPELIEHWSATYGISASGKITTLYPANFKPDQIVHDVPLLAKQ
ncbi:MAG TPA: SCO family protein [Thermoleophilaceae bacterium]